MIRMLGESMSDLKSACIINQYIRRLSTGSQPFSVMGEFHGPDFSGILTKLQNGPQWELTSVTHVIFEEGWRF